MENETFPSASFQTFLHISTAALKTGIIHSFLGESSFCLDIFQSPPQVSDNRHRTLNYSFIMQSCFPKEPKLHPQDAHKYPLCLQGHSLGGKDLETNEPQAEQPLLQTTGPSCQPPASCPHPCLPSALSKPLCVSLPLQVSLYKETNLLTFPSSYSQLLIHHASPPQDLGACNCGFPTQIPLSPPFPSWLSKFLHLSPPIIPPSTLFIVNNPETSVRNCNLNTQSAECYLALCSGDGCLMEAKGCFFQNALHTTIKIAQPTLNQYQLPFIQISGTTWKDVMFLLRKLIGTWN